MDCSWQMSACPRYHSCRIMFYHVHQTKNQSSFDASSMKEVPVGLKPLGLKLQLPKCGRKLHVWDYTTGVFLCEPERRVWT